MCRQGDHSMETNLIVVGAMAYMGLLFAIAHWGDNPDRPRLSEPARKIVYGLSIGVYFTSWTFFGGVGTAAGSGWMYLPIYLGPLLVFTLFYPILRRLVAVGTREHATTIADFISSRYGKSPGLAALVTLIAVLGSIPYIALQLKSVSMSLTVLTRDGGGTGLKASALVFAIALVLACFIILFGTRHVYTTQHNRGLVLAVAFETLVKTLALVAIGLLSVHALGSGELVAALSAPTSPFVQPLDTHRFLVVLLLSIGAVLCLPRQFHVTVVECQDEKQLGVARWVFVTCLLIMSVVILPITIAGQALVGDAVTPDLYVLALPMLLGNDWTAFLTFLGGFAASTGMIIVATVALSTMVTNDFLLAFLLRNHRDGRLAAALAGDKQILARRVTIFLLLMLASLFERGLQETGPLASLGLLSFAAAIQFLPAIIGGLYWRRGHKLGVSWGLTAGLASWVLLVMLPAFLGPDNPSITSFERPLLFTEDTLTIGVIVSMTLNILGYVIGSLAATPSVVDRVQATTFVAPSRRPPARAKALGTHTRIADLKALVGKSLGPTRMEEVFTAYELVIDRKLMDHEMVDSETARFAEQQIARVIGSASARIIVGSALTDGSVPIEDIATVLDEAQQKLSFSQEILQATIDNLGQGVSVVDANQKLVAWNSRYIEMFAYPPGLIQVGRPIEDVLRFNAQRGLIGADEGNLDDWVARRTGHLQAGTPHTFERWQPGGTVLKIEGYPMPGGGYVTSYTDITEAKRIELALRESERSIRFYTDNIPAMVSFVDAEECLQFGNKAFFDWFSRTGTVRIGAPVRDFMPAEDYTLRARHIASALAGKRQTFDIESRTAGGHKVFFQVSYTPQFGPSGEVTGFFVVYQDITSRRRAEVALQDAYDMLEQRVEERTAELQEVNDRLAHATEQAQDATRSKTRFLAAASHDLLQPLNAARLFASALAEEVRPEEAPAHDLIDKLDRAIQSADRLLRALLDISKLDGGGLKPNITTFPVSDVLADVANEFSVIAQEKGLRLSYIPSSLTIRSDRGLLLSVIQNLVSNAVRYTANGRILLGCRRRRDRLIVEVHDTGPGIPTAHMERIFKEFERLSPISEDDRTAQTGRGLGLGLAIVDRIVRMLELPLDVQSTVGKGSIFSVSLPVAGRRDAVAAPSLPRTVHGSFTGRHALAVDNDPQIQDALRVLLERWGCTVDTVATRSEAEQVFAERGQVPDFVLLDFQLDHGQTGPDLYEDMCVVWNARPPAALITAERHKLEDEELRAKFPILTKPVEPAGLRAVVTRLARMKLEPGSTTDTAQGAAE